MNEERGKLVIQWFVDELGAPKMRWVLKEQVPSDPEYASVESRKFQQ